MQNKLFLIGGLALCASSAFAENYFTISDFAVKPNEEIEVKVYLHIETALTAGLEDGGTSIDLILPEGLSVAKEWDDWDEVWVNKVAMAPNDKATGFTYGMTMPTVSGQKILLNTVGTKTKTGTFLYATVTLIADGTTNAGTIITNNTIIGEDNKPNGSVTFNVLKDITINENGYASYSVCAPVEVTGATVMGATMNGNALTLAGDGTTVPANTGVILKGNPGATVSFDAVEEADAITSDLTPSVLPTAVAAESVLTLSKLEAAFYTFIGTEIPAQKAYLDKPMTSGRVRIVESANGIDTIKGELNSVINYNLMGQQVKSQQGIVIENGKKVMNF